MKIVNIIKNIIGKIIYKITVKILIRYGYSRYMANYLLSSISDDILKKDRVSFRKKIWGFRRGFLSDRISRYSIKTQGLNVSIFIFL